VVEFTHDPSALDILLNLRDSILKDIVWVNSPIGIWAVSVLELTAQFHDDSQALFALSDWGIEKL
jgi:hypothetical protein